MRTAKSCGSDAPTLASSFAVNARRRWQTSPVTGKSTKETVKTIARGMPGGTRCDRGDYARMLFYFACEAAGALSARHSLRPLMFRMARRKAELGYAPRDRAGVCHLRARLTLHTGLLPSPVFVASSWGGWHIVSAAIRCVGWGACPTERILTTPTPASASLWPTLLKGEGKEGASFACLDPPRRGQKDGATAHCHTPPSPSRGMTPNVARLHGLLRWSRHRARIGATRWLAMTAPESVARSRGLQRRKHRVGDIGSTVPAAEFHRLDAVGIHLVNGALDTLAGFGCRLQAVLVGEPVQHHRGRQDHAGGIGLALSHNVGCGSMAWLEHCMTIADVGRWRHAHSADQAGGHIGQDVAEHILHHHHIEIPGTLDQQRRAGIDIESVGLYVRMALRGFVEHFTKEREGLEDIRLVDASKRAGPSARLAPLRQAERAFEQSLRGVAGDDDCLARLGIRGDALAHRRRQPPRGLADHDRSE